MSKGKRWEIICDELQSALDAQKTAQYCLDKATRNLVQWDELEEANELVAEKIAAWVSYYGVKTVGDQSSLLDTYGPEGEGNGA